MVIISPPRSAYLITKPENIRYLTGFDGEGFLLLFGKKLLLATDARYLETAERIQKKSFQLFEISKGWPDRLKPKLKSVSTILFEAHHMTVHDLAWWKKVLKGKQFRPAGRVVERKRTIKTEQEKSLIRTAARIADRVLGLTLPLLKPGVSEKAVANQIRKLFVDLADGPGYDPIVAFGKNTAIAHHVAGATKLKPNDVVLIDAGANYRGYKSDMTRCFFIGKGIPEVLALYKILQSVQEKAVDIVRPGLSVKSFDVQVRAMLGKHQALFTHALGHGIGLEIHEDPVIAGRSKDVIQEHIVHSVEPGLYKPGIGGVRIEDTVIVTKNGCEVVTKTGKSIRFLR